MLNRELDQASLFTVLVVRSRRPHCVQASPGDSWAVHIGRRAGEMGGEVAARLGRGPSWSVVAGRSGLDVPQMLPLLATLEVPAFGETYL